MKFLLANSKDDATVTARNTDTKRTKPTIRTISALKEVVLEAKIWCGNFVFNDR